MAEASFQLRSAQSFTGYTLLIDFRPAWYDSTSQLALGGMIDLSTSLKIWMKPAESGSK